MKTGVRDVIFELRNVQVTVSNDDLNKHFVSFSFLHPICLMSPDSSMSWCEYEFDSRSGSIDLGVDP